MLQAAWYLFFFFNVETDFKMKDLLKARWTFGFWHLHVLQLGKEVEKKGVWGLYGLLDTPSKVRC